MAGVTHPIHIIVFLESAAESQPWEEEWEETFVSFILSDLFSRFFLRFKRQFVESRSEKRLSTRSSVSSSSSCAVSFLSMVFIRQQDPILCTGCAWSWLRVEVLSWSLGSLQLLPLVWWCSYLLDLRLLRSITMFERIERFCKSLPLFGMCLLVDLTIGHLNMYMQFL